MKISAVFLLAVAFSSSAARFYDTPDSANPGDAGIQEYLRAETAKIETDLLPDSHEQWTKLRPKYLEEYFSMLGLSPRPEKTDLKATITRTLDRGDYVIDCLHYQSRPGLYVTANLYRPAKPPKEKMPAVLYVCGHSPRPRSGNKTAYQSHGIWFARHGYVCLMLDTLQLGEIAGIHHGTYRENRWWWVSRGYTSAGVECWNGIRGLDYLTSRDDVDASRIAVTGISGGGAATFWISAADERVKVAVPVSGMADLQSYVSDRVINGHCDCMFLHNSYQWPWARIAALIAPRPMLFVNSDKDPIFPMDANERVINRLERVYSGFGASDLVDSFVTIGGHEYRKDIRQGIFRFINIHLKGDAAPVTDTEIDLVERNKHPIEPEQLRVFPSDGDIPADAINAHVDDVFVPIRKVETADSFEETKRNLLASLRELSFRHFPEKIPAAKPVGATDYITETGIKVTVRPEGTEPAEPKRSVLFVASDASEAPDWLSEVKKPGDAVYILEPRGVGSSRWTRKNPPNYVERSHLLLGRTTDSGRIWDIMAVARHVADVNKTPVHVVAEGAAAGLAVYAAAMSEDIAGLTLRNLPHTHMETNAPALLNVLRVCDIPDALGLVAPRPAVVSGSDASRFAGARKLYKQAGAAKALTFRPP